MRAVRLWAGMCGRCALSANGMACPMNCPKQVRNGPCGGVRADGTCEAEPGMPCVGLQGRQGAAHMAVGHLPKGPAAAPEHERAGASTWLPIITGELTAPRPAVDATVRAAGDHVGNGDHPGARHVGDLDSVTLLAAMRRMCDAGELMSGRKLTAAPRLFLGAAGNPSAESVEIEIDRLRRKVAAGAQFVQTQYCFDLERLERLLPSIIKESGVFAGRAPLFSPPQPQPLSPPQPAVA